MPFLWKRELAVRSWGIWLPCWAAGLMNTQSLLRSPPLSSCGSDRIPSISGAFVSAGRRRAPEQNPNVPAPASPMVFLAVSPLLRQSQGGSRLALKAFYCPRGYRSVSEAGGDLERSSLALSVDHVFSHHFPTLTDSQERFSSCPSSSWSASQVH